MGFNSGFKGLIVTIVSNVIEQPRKTTMFWGRGSQCVLYGSKGIRDQNPGIRGYFTVMAALKFTRFFFN